MQSLQQSLYKGKCNLDRMQVQTSKTTLLQTRETRETSLKHESRGYNAHNNQYTHRCNNVSSSRLLLISETFAFYKRLSYFILLLTLSTNQITYNWNCVSLSAKLSSSSSSSDCGIPLTRNVNCARIKFA